jgi:hypothetical protein
MCSERDLERESVVTEGMQVPRFRPNRHAEYRKECEVDVSQAFFDPRLEGSNYLVESKPRLKKK